MSSIYVSGPMRGYADFNFPAFDELSEQLRSDDYIVVNPADHDREVYPDIEKWPGFAPGDTTICPEFDLHAALAWDLQQVATCDEFVLLPGWEDSSGATHERYVAEVTGKPIWLAHRHLGRVPYWSLEFDEEQLKVSVAHKAVFPSDPSGLRCMEHLCFKTECASKHETRIVNDKTGGEKGQKLARFDLIPAGPLTALAEHYGKGAAKYADRNWERGYAWSLSFGALQRHLWAFWHGEDVDAETGSSHLDAAAFHCFGLREFCETHRELDDRPRVAVEERKSTQQLVEELNEVIEHTKNARVVRAGSPVSNREAKRRDAELRRVDL